MNMIKAGKIIALLIYIVSSVLLSIFWFVIAALGGHWIKDEQAYTFTTILFLLFILIYRKFFGKNF